jgi:hypothetical protein
MLIGTTTSVFETLRVASIHERKCTGERMLCEGNFSQKGFSVKDISAEPVVGLVGIGSTMYAGTRLEQVTGIKLLRPFWR